MKYIIKLIATVVLVFTIQLLYSQTADVVEGCDPLEVNFTPPSGLTEYFWDFKDMTAGSNLSNPSHIFSAAGIYEVSLNNGTGPNSVEVGTITITVYPDLDIMIDAELIDLCSPKVYQFTNNTVLPNGITATGYEWDFGDGETSSQENPIHTYGQAISGNEDIKLTIFTDIAGCDNNKIFTAFINVSNEPTLQARFTPNPSLSCSVPSLVFFNSQQLENVSYLWDFGDGNTSTETQNVFHTYTEMGEYEATLTLTRGDCISTITRNIFVGDPLADFGFNDTLCLLVETTLVNNTGTDTFEWTFEESVEVDSTLVQEPIVTFTEPGFTTVRMVGRQSNDAMCLVDTTFQIYIQDPEVLVTKDPEVACTNPLVVEVTTTEPFASYVWYGEEGDRTYTISYEEPERDSFWVNAPLEIPIDLTVTTHQGCIAILDDFILFQQPEAHFIPNVHNGCAPLAVTFRDTSTSAEPLISFSYDYGNGDTQTFTNKDDHTYTFNDPGDYLVTLVVENEVGCIDTSWAVLIEVGEEVPLSYEIDKTELCIGDTVTLNATNIDPRIDAFNLWTDDGRSHHCPPSGILEHSFITNTGSFDVEYTVDYNGCRTTVVDEDAITVNGPKADLWYMINCDDPLAVMFADSSQDATSIEWTFENNITSDLADLTHTFPESGDYTVYLEASNVSSGCPNQIDSIVVFAREIEAVFDLPDNLCDNLEYYLDATASIDVDSTCFKGYTWYFTQNNRPRRVGVPVLQQVFAVPGEEIVTLEVEDINGCTNRLSDTVNVVGIRPFFEFDKEPICFPSEVTFNNLTESDTTITNFVWSHGVQGAENLVEFGTGETVTETFDFFELDLEELPIYLDVTDAFGCEDQIQLNVDVYRPLTNISASSDKICVGGTINFLAQDITGQGSTLDYIWDFGEGQTSSDSSVSITYETSNTYNVTLNLTEESTGCQNEQSIEILVTDLPVAEFTGTQNGMTLGPDDPVCFNQSIVMINETIQNNNPLNYFWFTSPDLTDVDSESFDPSITIGEIGRDTVFLIALSDYGCSDTISHAFNLVGSEGDFDIDKLVICKNDSITVNLKDTSDVASWVWDDGIGNTYENIDPLTIVYSDEVSGNSNVIQLILLAPGINCEVDTSKTITFLDIISDTIRSTHIVERGEEFRLPLKEDNPELFNWTRVVKSINPDTVFYIPPAGVECFDCNNPSVNTNTEECLTYVVKYSDPNSMDAMCTEHVYIFEVNPIPLEVVIPNLFTPNGDDKNDFFNYVEFADTTKGSAIETVLEFRIYNRWGKLVYDNDDPARGWNGIYEGSPAPAEVYGYYFRAQSRFRDENGNPVILQEKGDVTLLR